MSTAFWMTVTWLPAPLSAIMPSSSHCPSRPPATEPMASGIAVAKGILVLASICLPMDTADMLNTVMEDRTPMVSTSKSPSRSITGLMMTPPPIPVSEPTVVARMASKK